MLRFIILVTVAACTLYCFAIGYWQAAVIGSSIAWLFYLAGTLRPSSRMFGPVITRLASDEVAITIDDGPDPLTTPALLKVLALHQIQATFFLIGKRAEANPDLVRAISAAGHAIGNHTQTHPSGSFWALGPWRMLKEIQQCQQVLKNILGHEVSLYRSPAGHTNPLVQPILNQLGLKRVAWSARGYDAVRKDVPAILKTIQPDLKPGAIILIHEATSVAEAVLTGLIDELNRRQLTCAVIEAQITLPRHHLTAPPRHL
jgi:peptidoglycan/xylan/chitin deacetylase (PgdA/CDA1 family)